jgi:hypothetical protein
MNYDNENIAHNYYLYIGLAMPSDVNSSSSTTNTILSAMGYAGVGVMENMRPPPPPPHTNLLHLAGNC